MAVREKVAEILASVYREGRLELMEFEAKRLLAAWGVPVNRTGLAKNLSEAVELANDIHYPVVLKIASPDIIHKSEARGVKVGLGSEPELRHWFN